MFTSKKAQVLNKKLDKISPITNIDTLYYEQATFDGTDFTIKRRSVTKTMPINVNFIDSSNFDYQVGGTPIPLDISTEPTIISSGFEKSFDGNFFKYTGNYVNLSYILNNYETIENFNTSVNNLNISINSSINELYNYIEHTIDDVINSYVNASLGNIYSSISTINNILEQKRDIISDSINPSIININTSIYNYVNNITKPYDTYTHQQFLEASAYLEPGTYYMEYDPYDLTHFNHIETFLIELQLVIDENIPRFISTGRAKNMVLESHIFNADKCYVEYNFDQNRITYLRDEFDNEADFDFINIRTKWPDGTEGIAQANSNKQPVFKYYERNYFLNGYNNFPIPAQYPPITNNKLFNVINSDGYCNITFLAPIARYNQISNIQKGKCIFSNAGSTSNANNYNIIKNVYDFNTTTNKNTQYINIKGSGNTIKNLKYSNFSEVPSNNKLIIKSNNTLINTNFNTRATQYDNISSFSLFYIEINNTISNNLNIKAENMLFFYNILPEYISISQERKLTLNNCIILNSENNIIIGGKEYTLGYPHIVLSSSTAYNQSIFMLDQNIKLVPYPVAQGSGAVPGQTTLEKQFYIGSHKKYYSYNGHPGFIYEVENALTSEIIYESLIGVYCNSYQI